MDRAETRKIATQIYGLDKVLKGEFDIGPEPFVIVIRGTANSHRTLLGTQLLYGLALSMKEQKIANEAQIEPYFISLAHAESFIEEMMLDTLIAAFFHALIKVKIENPNNKTPELTGFTKFFFDTTSIAFLSNTKEKQVSSLVKDISETPEELIANSVLYYNSQTKALHFRTVNHVADETNLVYRRRCDSICEYADMKASHNISGMKSKLGLSLVRMHVVTPNNLRDVPEKVKLLGYELNSMFDYSANEMKKVIDSLKNKAGISVLIVNKDTRIPDTADIIIDLSNRVEQDYVFHYMTIFKNLLQQTSTEVHQYKARDFGIEVFPNLHVYYFQKRYFHRSFIYTHGNMVDHTYPQYLDRKRAIDPTVKYVSYDDYIKEKESLQKTDMAALYLSNGIEYISCDLLNKIFMSSKEKQGLVTAVVGGGNTFKRFITMGSAFSSAVQGEDTLIVMLNKEQQLIQKRMSCPARLQHCCHKDKCAHCYRHFHLMNIYPEFITAAEFVYVLNQHIRLAYDTNRHVKRIIIDGMQALDYNFPYLKKDCVFLPALMNLCRKEGILLYLLCDKKATICGELIAAADNVVYTEKTYDGNPRVYIERCLGYYNPPSKMYCGEIKHIKRAFECKEQYVKNGEQMTKVYDFAFDPLQIKDKLMSNLDDFWK